MGLEGEIVRFFFSASEPYLVPLFTAVTAFASTYVIAAYPLALYSSGKKYWSKVLGKALILDTVIVYAIKTALQRPRPAVGLENVVTSSFPSGHASYAFVLAVVLSAAFPRARRFLFGFATLVALTRVFLGYHYPSDILVGAVIGYLSGYYLLYRNGESPIKDFDHILKRGS